MLSIGKNGCAVIDFKHLEVGTVKLSVKGQGKISFNVGESVEEVLNKVSKDNEQKALPVKEGFISINVDKDRNCSIEIPNNCIVHIGDMNNKKTFRKKGVYSCKLRK